RNASSPSCRAVRPGAFYQLELSAGLEPSRIRTSLPTKTLNRNQSLITSPGKGGTSLNLFPNSNPVRTLSFLISDPPAPLLNWVHHATPRLCPHSWIGLDIIHRSGRG